MTKIIFAHDHKIREFQNTYYTTGGLSEAVTNRYLKYSDELILACRVITENRYNPNWKRIENKKISVLRTAGSSFILKKNGWKQLEEAIISCDALVVRLHSIIGTIAIKLAKQYGKPYLVELVGCPWDSYWNHSMKGKFAAPIMFLITKKLVKNADYVVYVTEDFLQKRYPTKGKSLACSDVELEVNNEGVLEKRLLHIKNRKEKLILGTLANLDVKYKRQEDVIKALSILKKEGKMFEYHLAGSGSSKRLEKIAKQYHVQEEVIFDGMIDHEMVFEWLDQLDIYIQPSKQEGLPRAVVEAMSRACPIIGSTAGGIYELISPVCIFKKGNIKQIAIKLNMIDEEFLLKQAEENFYKSALFQKEKLDKKRNQFYEKFFMDTFKMQGAKL